MLNLEDSKRPGGGIDSRWTNNVIDKESLLKQLKSQTVIWRQFLKILKELYRNAHSDEFDLDKPNIKERLLYNEGYKKALMDVYKLIPTQGDQPYDDKRD